MSPANAEVTENAEKAATIMQQAPTGRQQPHGRWLTPLA